MSWEDFESEREARNFGAEMYKKLIIKYFQTQGYYLLKNSLFEGTLSDIVMEKSGKIIWIEAKNTKVSIFAKTDPLRRELLEYFYYWLITKKEKKFGLIIFVINIARKKDTKRILTLEAYNSEILDWFNDKEDLKLTNEVIKKINTATDKEIITFFKSISIKICSPFGLHQRVKQREQEIRRNVNAYHKKILREVKSRKAPIKEKSEIIINFMELEYPVYFWQATSKYRLKRTFFRKLNPSNDFSLRLPEFVVPRFENIIPVVRSFEKDLSPLRPYIIGHPYDRETRFLEIQRKRELLYTSLRRYLWCKGLRRDSSVFYFAYENPLDTDSNVETNPIEIKGTKKPKKVSKPRYRDDGTLNFVEHHSLKIRLEEYDGKIGISIWPSILFTSNGINRIRGDHASRLHRKYLKPVWNRNQNKRSLLRFWEVFLTSENFVREKDSWFNHFKIKSLLKQTVPWSSKTIDKDQERLDLFLENGGP
ncbi:hypothetical protein LCGC14_1151430 [marine sediment metagenome]|uniref:Uncharacterized protein n=1 Tax=marine sediment metagenome TaxID=412755 RepID=A0A0F9M096_9ZZZZ